MVRTDDYDNVDEKGITLFPQHSETYHQKYTEYLHMADIPC